MVAAVHTPTKRLLAGGALVLAALAIGCTGGSTSDRCPGDDAHTIGDYCTPIITAFCHHAVDDCHILTSSNTPETVDDCINRAMPTCCQGACGRGACTVAPETISACIQAYAGTPTAQVLDGGTTSSSGGLDCRSVAIGVSPAACQSIITLK